jgi:hypothetical protein
MIWDIDLIFGMRVYNHKLQINFECILLGWFLANLQLLGFEIWPNIIIFFTMIWDIDLIFGMWVYCDALPIKFEFRSDWMILG